MLEWSIRVAVQAAASFVELFPQVSDLLGQAAICPLAMNPLSIMLRSSEDAVDWLHWPLDDQHVSQTGEWPEGNILVAVQVAASLDFFSDGDTLTNC